jgi:hypothetical protein
MNRNILIGGGVAGALVIAGAGWYFLGSGPGTTPGGDVAGVDQGPIALNPVSVITDHTTALAEDGRKLTINFPKFELAAKAGETTSAVFSTSWRLKLGPDERAVVAAVTLNGYMKSNGTPVPAAPVAQPAAEPTVAAPADSTAPATPPAEGTPPAEQPAAAPKPAPVAKPVAGDGVARVVVTIGNETSVTEWRDWTGEGAAHKVSKAASFIGANGDVRDGGTVPVTVTVEVSGASATDTLARLSALDLLVVAENAPLPKPEAPAAPATLDSTTAAPPADAPTTAPATPPAEPAPAAPPT